MPNGRVIYFRVYSSLFKVNFKNDIQTLKLDSVICFHYIRIPTHPWAEVTVKQHHNHSHDIIHALLKYVTKPHLLKNAYLENGRGTFQRSFKSNLLKPQQIDIDRVVMY